MVNRDRIINNSYANLEQKTLGVLFCVAQEIHAKYMKALLPFGLSPLQLNILHVLDHGPKEGLTVNQIRKMQIEENPNISRVLNKLMEKGYIIKSRNKLDQRVVYIQITEQGLALHRKCDKVSSSILKLDLPDDDIESLFTLLNNCNKR